MVVCLFVCLNVGKNISGEFNVEEELRQFNFFSFNSLYFEQLGSNQS